MTLPCLKGRCRSPLACHSFGYCRELNLTRFTVARPVPERAPAICDIGTYDGQAGAIIDIEVDHDQDERRAMTFAVIQLDGGATIRLRLPDVNGRWKKRET